MQKKSLTQILHNDSLKWAYDICKWVYLKSSSIVFYAVRGVVSLRPLQNKVVATAYNGKRYDDNTRYIVEKIHELDPDIPIAVLANNGSVSNSEVMLLIFRELQEKGRAIGIIGGSSAGAFGAVVDDDSVYNAGQFSVDPFITLVYTPSVQHAAADGTFYEGIGIAPDIPIPFSYEDFTGNAGPDGNPAKEKYDARLNEAFDFIRNH